jgi:hypothetical protein
MKVSTLGAWALALANSFVYAAETGIDVLRLQQQREQQQLELRLKMQQQQERAAHPALTPSGQSQRFQIERDQQQRQRETHDQQLREAIAVEAAPDDTRNRLRAETERAAEYGAGELQRLEIERRLESRRNETPSTR